MLSNMDIAALAELRTHTQWVAWRHKEIVKADGTKKLTKPPVSPIHGGGASHSKPADWGTFDQARVFAMSRKMAGVGFVLAEGDGYTGIDLDKCRDPATGEIEPWARAILDLAETYAEISPSGTGIRLIARGKVEHATKSDPAHVEIYGKQRYLTITGDHVAGAPDDIREAPQTIAALKARAAEHQSAAEARARAAQPEAKPAAPAKEPLDFFGGRDRKATPRPDAPKAKKPKRENDFFRGVNDAAMCDPGWFLNIFPRAKWYPGSGDYRVSSVDLGRSLEEDISFKLGSSGGIVDFGVHDMGDARRGRRTPVDVVIEHGGAPDAKAAAFWLCERLGRTPEDFGWGERAPEPANDHQPHDASAEPRAGAERANDASPNRGAAKPPLIQATPYSWPDPASIPVREWLYGRHLIRRFVSTTIAPGGVGKSSLTIAEAVSMICGRPLLHGVKPASALNVWLVNLEDPLEEIERRVAATMKHYGLRREDCPGHLYVNSGRDCELVVAKMTRGEMEVHRPLVDAVKATIAANQIDALIIDPFVRSHRLPENSNEAIDLAVSEWAKIADEASCAVDLVHHARKTGGMEVTVEDGRGASAMISATARRVPSTR
ncbi:MAG: AAA family ATPase [Rhodoblastus sp.]|nr:MAG: AAA family ATPase [Rhodoblastus sp.]